MVDFFLDEIENVLELDYAVERKFLHLNRDYHLVSRRKSVHDQYSERGQAVDEEIIVILRYAVAGNRLVKNLLAAHRLGKKHIRGSQRNIRRDIVDRLVFRSQNALRELRSFFQNVNDGALTREIIAKVVAEISLRVKVDTENFLAKFRKSCGDIYHGRCLANAAFLVCYCYNLCHNYPSCQYSFMS